MTRFPEPPRQEGRRAWVNLDATAWADRQTTRRDLTISARFVLVTLAHRVKGDLTFTGRLSDIAPALGIAVKTLEVAFADLVAAGLLEAVKQRGPEGRNAAAVYRLTMAPSPQNLPAGQDAKSPSQDVKSASIDKEGSVHTYSTNHQYENARERGLVFPIDGPGGPEWELPTALVDELSGLFQTLDVPAECRKALAWVLANPDKRKTASGMRKFLTGWLTRAVDTRRAAPPGYANGRQAGPPMTLKRRIDMSDTGDALREVISRSLAEAATPWEEDDDAP